MKWILIGLLSFSAHAEVWRAHGAGASMKLKVNKTNFHYKGRLVNADLEIKKCNQQVIADFMKGLRRQIGGKPFLETSKLRLNLDQHRFGVIPTSGLGKALLSMDDNVLKLKAQESVLCSR